MTSCCVSQKVNTENGSGPRVPSERPRDTDHSRPLAARTLTLSGACTLQVGQGPWPVRRGLVWWQSSPAECEKVVFFRCPGRLFWEQNKRSQSLVWVSTPQRQNLFVPVLRSHNCRPQPKLFSFSNRNDPNTGYLELRRNSKNPTCTRYHVSFGGGGAEKA